MANRVVARDQANGKGINREDLAASAAATTRIGYRNRVRSCSICINTTGSSTRAPQIADATCYTKLSGLVCTNRIIARNRAHGLRIDGDGFATNADATAGIGHSDCVGGSARGADCDSCSGR